MVHLRVVDELLDVPRRDVLRRDRLLHLHLEVVFDDIRDVALGLLRRRLGLDHHPRGGVEEAVEDHAK
eukprot:15831007-Heterocapsa_arctica.AAC.1